MEYMIESKKLSKAFHLDKGNAKIALREVDIGIRKGEFVAVVGPSGSGKSTLLHTISGMERMSSGSVVFDGNELAAMSEEDIARLRLTRMGFVFQNMHLLRNLSIRDNILAPAYLAKKNNRAEINERTDFLMGKTGITDIADNDISQVSGGQLQRAALCRALINDPELIFGDEPTGALDSRSANEIMELLTGMHREGRTIVLVTHDVKVAARAERVCFMLDGSLA